MALTTFITYVTASGVIKRTEHRDDGDPPTSGGGESVLDAGMQDPLPTKKTHKVDTAGPTLLAKSSGDQQAEADDETKRRIEMILADLDNRKAAANTRGFFGAENDIDAEIADLEAKHAALP